MQELSLTMKPGRLKPSDEAPDLQYGSGSSSEFLAKILGVDTRLLLCNNFTSHFLHCCFIIIIEVSALMLSAVFNLIACLPTLPGAGVGCTMI
jgi:hypothetical protein